MFRGAGVTILVSKSSERSILLKQGRGPPDPTRPNSKHSARRLPSHPHQSVEATRQGSSVNRHRRLNLSHNIPFHTVLLLPNHSLISPSGSHNGGHQKNPFRWLSFLALWLIYSQKSRPVILNPSPVLHPESFATRHPERPETHGRNGDPY